MARDRNAAAVHCLRIGKTGTTTLKKLINEEHVRRRGGRKIVLHPHRVTMSEALADDARDQVVFFLRDPVSRFVSGFNSRLREGAPHNVLPWKPDERVVFTRFPTPNDLAEALSDPDEVRQDQAFVAIDTLIHSRMHYTYWLRDISYLESRLHRIGFIGFQESFDEDVRRLLRRLGVRRELAVEARHQAPDAVSTTLSPAAVANLERWYARDREIYEWALAQRDRWAETPASARPA